ncbi:MAG TPA: putative Ig domain-containing protein, partial [Thermoguttaceae bacterium]|nr:putative Ig domain-containing protein [Thermoguttaceae bacterium]
MVDYRKLLGITEASPDHYRLLGIDRFEADVDAISNAADRQMIYLRTMRNADAEKLLNEVAAARVCLLNPKTKAAYDKQLRQSQDRQQTTQASPEVDEIAQFKIESTPARPGQIAARRGQTRKIDGRMAAIIAAAVAAVVVLVVVVIVLLPSSPQKPDPGSSPDRPAVADEQRTARETAPKIGTSPKIRPPALAAIPEQTVEAGGQFTCRAVVDDPGEQGAKLTFEFGPNVPPGMTIDSDSGKINWQLADDQSPGQFAVTVKVVSSAPGRPSDQQSFVVRVEPKAAAPAVVESPQVVSRPDVTPMTKPEPETEPATEREPGSEPEPGIVRTVPESPKQAVPDEAKQDEIVAKVRDLFADSYDSSVSPVRLALAAQLIQNAQQTSDSPEQRYVLLSQARNIAAEEGDCLLALAAVDELAKTFDVDPVAMKVEALGLAADRARSSAKVNQICESTFALADEAIADEAFDTILTVIRDVSDAARKINGASMAKVVQQRREELQDRRLLHDAAKVTAAKLADNPDDP